MNDNDRSGQPADVIQTVRQGYDELTKSQKWIAEAIVDDPEFVAFATVDKMASRLGVSPSTVVRFTYRL
jgi:DNA-binding MurR/RpiR family transcriptional regulator